MGDRSVDAAPDENGFDTPGLSTPQPESRKEASTTLRRRAAEIYRLEMESAI